MATNILALFSKQTNQTMYEHCDIIMVYYLINNYRVWLYIYCVYEYRTHKQL